MTAMEHPGQAVVTPEVRQGEAAECALASLAIVLGYHGIHVPLEELREAAGSTYVGTSASVLVKLAQQYGLVARSLRAEPETLPSIGFPLIVHCRFIHFVVLEAMRPRYVRVNDPASGPRWMPVEEFDLEFTGIALSFSAGPQASPRGRAFAWPRYWLAGLARHRSLIAVLALLALAAVFAAALGIRLGAHALDRIAAGLPASRLIVGTALAGLAAALAAAFRGVAACRLAAESAVAALARTRRMMPRLPAAFFVDRQPSQIMEKLDAPIVLADQVELVGAIGALASPVVLGATAALIDPWTGGLILGCVLLDICAVVFLCGRRAGMAARFGDGAPPLVAPAAEIIAQMDVHRIGGGDAELFGLLAGQHAELATSAQEAGAQFAMLQAWRLFLAGVRVATALGFAGIGLLETRFELGDAVGLLALALAVGVPLDSFARCCRLAALKEAVHELADLDRTRPMAASSQPPAKLADAGCRVVITNLAWSGGLEQPLVIDGLASTIEPGMHLGIAGPSASGKTVLSHLLTGLKQPTRGTVLIDGCTPTELRAGTAALVERVGALFDVSVRDNLLLGDSFPEEALRSALQDVELWDELTPRGGLNLALSRGGVELSGGQRSRLQLARALLRKPRLLVIDGALDSVELSQEARIRAILRRRGSTVVQVSARAESLSACDRVLRLVPGQAAVEQQP